MDRSLSIAAAVATAVVGVAVVAWPSSPEPPPVELVATAELRQVTVHVSGAVMAPGLVTVARDARVADAVAAAGGAAPGADLGALNLAAGVGDGSRVVVPVSGTGSPAAGDGLVRLNSADVSELAGLPGVGPVLAERIISHRDDHGPFAAVEDLLEVSGIGEAKLAALRDAVLVP